jgi:hypothetical protein
VLDPQRFFGSGESQEALEKIRNTNPRLPKPFVNLSYDKGSNQFFGPQKIAVKRHWRAGRNPKQILNSNVQMFETVSESSA